MINKNTLKRTGITMLSVMALSSSAIIPVAENAVSASAATRTHYEVKQNKKAYVYKNKHIKATKSHSAKHYFGKHKLTVKHTVVVKRHGKHLVYKFVVASNGKSGYVYAGSLKKVAVKHVAKVKKAKKVTIKKTTPKKKVVKKTTQKKNSGKVVSSTKITGKTTGKVRPHTSTSWTDIVKGNSNGSTSNGGDNSNSGSTTTTPMTNEQFAQQIKDQFINYVNNQRRLNGKQPWVQNAALTRVAEKRVSYVDPDTGSASHYTTADGVYHAEGAPVVDAASLGYNMSSDLHESNADYAMTYQFANVNSFVGGFSQMITNDEDNGNGHRDQLLGNKGQGLNNVGVAVRVFKYTNSAGIDALQANIVILSSDNAY